MSKSCFSSLGWGPPLEIPMLRPIRDVWSHVECIGAPVWARSFYDPACHGQRKIFLVWYLVAVSACVNLYGLVWRVRHKCCFVVLRFWHTCVLIGLFWCIVIFVVLLFSRDMLILQSALFTFASSVRPNSKWYVILSFCCISLVSRVYCSASSVLYAWMLGVALS